MTTAPIAPIAAGIRRASASVGSALAACHLTLPRTARITTDRGAVRTPPGARQLTAPRRPLTLADRTQMKDGTGGTHHDVALTYTSDRVDVLSRRGEQTWSDLVDEQVLAVFAQTDPEGLSLELARLGALTESWRRTLRARIERRARLDKLAVVPSAAPASSGGTR